ncbi:MAG: efflux RND transporter periplasmic adaptor subunit [Ignavibacteria bacterium]|nr:efflux RND transporter periplasmic adaptor subunit [Ignavibacteria bacterium]
MKKTLLYIFLVVAVLGSSGYYYFNNSKTEEVQYRTEKITRGDIVVRVRATGTINPKRNVQVGSQVSGTILKLFADFNSVVHAGQVVAIIDSTFLFASVKESEANLERVQAQVNEAQRNLNRIKGLFEKGLVSQAENDKAQTDLETANAQRKQSHASLERAKVNLRYAVIRSPIDGIVISRDVDVGQTVAASFQAPKLFVVANDLQTMQVEANVDEADIGQVKEGQEVTFTVDAYPEEEFKGTVTQVRIAPIQVQNVVTYTVIIEVPNDEMKLRPGMTATVSILVNKRENVLRIPALALRFQPPMDVLEKISSQKDSSSSMSNVDSEKRSDGVVEKWSSSDSSMKNKNGENGERRMRRGDGEWKNRREGEQRGERREFSNEQMQQWKERREGAKGMDKMKMSKRNFARVWMLVNGKDLKQVRIRTGITDNRFIEIFSEDLKEGDEVIVGMNGNEMSSMQGMQNQNPFAPRMPGGGGGGGGGMRRGF